MSYKHTALVLLAVVVVISMLVSSCLPRIFFVELIELPVHEPPRTVVSISSFSQRVFHMKECLDSVYAQSQVPDRIIISIPKKFRSKEKTACWFFDIVCYHDNQHYNESVEGMVDWFSEYTGIPYTYSVNLNTRNISYLYEFGILTVQFLDDDWGPATKLMGGLLLETHPETVIITLDDDMVYHKDTVQWLATHMQDNISLSFGCEMWTADRKSFIDFTMWSIHDFYMTSPRVCDGWLVGWTGVAHHVSSFGPDIWTFPQTLPVGCFYNDDILLSGYVDRKGVQKVYAPMVMQHTKHMKHSTLSLGTIVDTIGKYRFPCARYLFPT